MINVQEILDFQSKNVAEWHLDIVLTADTLPWKFIEENNLWNFKLWHEEDVARIKDIDPVRMISAKRNIDQFNQSRNNAMEKIDEWILNYLESNGVRTSDQLHSETPGMMIDRLSIMGLKKYHMLEETHRDDASEEHKAKCRQRVQILEEQISDLAGCLGRILEELEHGNLKFKVYRQLKMYNDPSLNPQLYKREIQS